MSELAPTVIRSIPIRTSTKPPTFRPPRRKPAPKRQAVQDPFYQSPEWRALRAACLERDGYQCTMADCPTPDRGRGGVLIADSIKPRREGGPITSEATQEPTEAVFWRRLCPNATLDIAQIQALCICRRRRNTRAIPMEDIWQCAVIYLRYDRQFAASGLQWRQYIHDLEKLGCE